jgi:hypothetical protein
LPVSKSASSPDVRIQDTLKYSGFQCVCTDDGKALLKDKNELLGVKYRIWGKELESLKNWWRWHEEFALAGHYEYIFRTTSIGIAVRVVDIENDESTDITDYGCW